MTPVMEGVESEAHLDLLVQKVTPLLAHQALGENQVHQEEAMMGHQGRPDLQDHPFLELPGAHRLSMFLDHRDHLECLDYLDSPQG